MNAAHVHLLAQLGTSPPSITVSSPVSILPTAAAGRLFVPTCLSVHPSPARLTAVDAWTCSSTAQHRLEVEERKTTTTTTRTGRKRGAPKEKTLSPQLILINAKSLLLGGLRHARLASSVLLIFCSDWPPFAAAAPRHVPPSSPHRAGAFSKLPIVILGMSHHDARKRQPLCCYCFEDGIITSCRCYFLQVAILTVTNCISIIIVNHDP